MIEPGKSAKTVDGRTVVFLPKTRKIKDIKILVGVVEGQQGYGQWTEEGKPFGVKDKNLEIASDAD